MIRAGVPQSVAMAVSVHRTISIFLRYNITSGDDIREAMRRTEEYRTNQPKQKALRAFPIQAVK